MNKQTLFTSLVLTFIVGLMAVIIFGSKSNSDIQNTPQQTTTIPTEIMSNTPIFYYGNTCPHCADVEEWINDHKIEEKITIIKKEVYDNRANSLELTQAAEHCGLPTDSIGVPFLYAEGTCLIGTPDIINYLTEITQSSEATQSAERSIE